MDPYIRLLFLEASSAGVGETEIKTAKAVSTWVKNQDDDVLYIKSKHLSGKVNNILTPKQIAKGIEWMEKNSSVYGVSVDKRAYTSGTTWKLEEM